MTAAPASPPTAAPEPPRPSGGRMARNAVHLLLGQVVTTALTIVLSAVVGRVLGASEYGLLYLVVSITAFGYVFVEMGQTMYGVREVARHPERAGDLMGSAIALRVAAAAAVSVLAYLSAWLLGYDGLTRVLTALMTLAWIPMLLAQGFSIVFRGLERMDLDSVVNVVLKALLLVASVAALLLGGRVTSLILAYLVAGGFSLAVALWLYRRMGLPPLRATRGTSRELVHGGLPLVTMSVAIAVQPYVNAILLSKLSDTAVIGWYGAAWNIAGTLVAPASILGAAAYPHLSRAAGSGPEFNAAVRKALRPLLFLAALGAVGTYLFADLAISIVYGAAKFAPAGDTLRAFAPMLLLVFLDMLLGNAILAAGKAKRLASAKLLAVVITSGLELVLIPVCQRELGNGGVGVMLAMAAGELVMVVAAVILIPRGAIDRAVLLDVGRAAVAGAGTLALVRALPSLGIPLCVVGFTVISAAVGLLKRADVEALQGALSRRKGAVAETTPS